MVIDPKSPIGQERNGGIPTPKILTVLCDKQMKTFKQIFVNIIHNTAGAVIRIGPSVAIRRLDRDTFSIEIYYKFTD
jgi:hypothetical protein